MNISPAVSIIVSVYNTEKYLNECLESLADQTLKDIEIIVVNDCSTDNSQTIINEYTKKDSRFKCINNLENQGVGMSRNIGAAMAKGRYIATIDSDDVAAPNLYEKLFYCAQSNNLDISICAFYYWFPSDNVKTYAFSFSDALSSKPYFSKQEIGTLIYELPVMPWNRIYSRKFHELFVNYPSNTLYEDNAAHYKAVHHAVRIGIINEPLYYYRQARPGSIMTKPTDVQSLYIQLQLICSIYEHEMHIKESRIELRNDILMFTSRQIRQSEKFTNIARQYINKHFKNSLEWDLSSSFCKHTKNKLFLSKFSYRLKKFLYKYQYRYCFIPSIRKRLKKLYIDNFR